MFTIDLLKGTGVPIKNSPGTVALKALPFVLPLVVAVYLVGTFQFNRTVIAMEQSGVEKMQDKLTEYAADIQQVRQWNTATEQTRKNLAEVTRGLGRHVQWSQTLADLRRADARVGRPEGNEIVPHHEAEKSRRSEERKNRSTRYLFTGF